MNSKKCEHVPCYAGSGDWCPSVWCKHHTPEEPGYPKGFIDLTRLTQTDAPTVEPGRKHK